jgi:uncharacterized protein DUF6968
MNAPKREVPIGDVIAERSFILHHSDGSEHAATLRIGKPTPPPWTDPPPPPFVCPFELVGLSKPEGLYSVGIDGVQALVLAFRVLPSWLAVVADIDSGRFFYLGGNDLGLPAFETQPSESE